MKLQKVIEFKELSFWGSQPDIKKLNEKIESLNRDGWKVVNITSNVNIVGIARSYLLLVEKQIMECIFCDIGSTRDSTFING